MDYNELEETRAKHAQKKAAQAAKGKAWEKT
jgi:hypothetical protein